ncbi:MAG: cyclic nucleotide-binding domain-containing protein, partial [Chloroflexota bacterium]
MDERAIDHLHKVEMFAGLNNTELAQVAGMCQAVRVDAERTVFKEGDAGNELYIIHEGHVRVLINTRRPDGSIGQST